MNIFFLNWMQFSARSAENHIGMTQLRHSASQRDVLPAAAWYIPIFLCAVFRAARGKLHST
jgi:hypothetical protein